MLYYADESHVCTNGYVPYGWQFKNEDIYIPSEKAARLNIFGMITKRNQYKGFTTQESINADKIVDYLVILFQCYEEDCNCLGQCFCSQKSES